MLKNISIAILSLITSYFSAQVKIGSGNISSKSVSLEFASANRGLILPYVESSSSVLGQTNGTLIYDAADNMVKVKYNSGWFNLSQEGDVDTSIQTGKTETNSATTIIGANSTSVPGVLVLEDSEKSMVLPKVNSPHTAIVNPSAGLIVYDTNKGQLAIFDGLKWNFWTDAD